MTTAYISCRRTQLPIVPSFSFSSLEEEIPAETISMNTKQSWIQQGIWIVPPHSSLVFTAVLVEPVLMYALLLMCGSEVESACKGNGSGIFLHVRSCQLNAASLKWWYHHLVSEPPFTFFFSCRNASVSLTWWLSLPAFFPCSRCSESLSDLSSHCLLFSVTES